MLGATRHSIWVSVESSSPSLACSTVLGRGPLPWDSERAGEGQDDIGRHNRGHSLTPAAATKMTSPQHQNVVGTVESKVTSWSRAMVREIVGHPDAYVISRGSTPADKLERPVSPTSEHGYQDGTGQHKIGVATAVAEMLRTDKFRSMLSRWTPAMDKELRRRLENLAQSLAFSSPLDLPFDTLEKLPTSTDAFPLTSSLVPTEIWARGTLLLYVNNLIVPLLPLVDAVSDGHGPLGTLVYKCRHLIFNEAKLALLGM